MVLTTSDCIVRELSDISKSILRRKGHFRGEAGY